MAQNFNDLQNKFSNVNGNNKEEKEEKIQLYSDFDELKLYFGEPYWVTDKICIYQPTIGDILKFGDTKFYNIVMSLCGNSTIFRLQLHRSGIDWNEVSDFDMFYMMSRTLTPKHTSLIFGDLNLSWFEAFQNNIKNCKELIYIPRDENGNYIEIDYDEAIKIDEFVYQKMVNYLREMFDVHPKTEFAKNNATKEAILWEDEENEKIRIMEQKKHPYDKSYLLPLVSSLVNHPGFKYKSNELKELNIYQFMDSVKRLQVYENKTALLKGMYSGFVDGSAIKQNDINWLCDLS